MRAAHYRLPTTLAASLSLALTGCATTPPWGTTASGTAASSASPTGATPADATPTPAAAPQQATSPPPRPADDDDIDTEATIWTVLGLAKRPSYRQPGPQTGATVSPILWQASLDTLGFVKFASEDPLGGSLVTEWYSPPDKPNERLRITVFVLDRALRSDSLAVTVDRQERSATGQWTDTTIARKVEEDLETTILHRARQLRRAWAPPRS
jgi:hypothetical protein